MRPNNDLDSLIKEFPALEPIYTDILADRYEKLDELSGRLDAVEPPERRMAVKRLVVLANFRRGDIAGSVTLCREVAENTGAGTDWFNLARAALTAGDVPLAQDSFVQMEAAYEAGNYGEQISSVMLRFYFAQFLKERGEYGLAFGHVERMRAVYEELHITDDTFVYMRGVPMLGHTMELAMSLFPHLAGQVDPAKWLDAFAKKLDDEGRNYLAECRKEFD
ncbi:MAG: tetratricopeptide repeat protein [Nitrospirae bacterium]|nr:tetratricopeptide repeat protein [Nitrospirota bacterium]